MNADAATTAGTIHIEVAYALPDKQQIMALDVAPGCTALQAVQLSGITQLFPEIDLATAVIGIWSVVLTGDNTPASYVVRDGDRVEIYRPLQLDPKESRRRRAEQARRKRMASKPA